MSIYEKLDNSEKRIRADLEDKVIDIIFSVTNKAVFHGGTCVWRCFGGERFSEGISIYVENENAIKRIIDRLIYYGYRTKFSTAFSKHGVKLYFYNIEDMLDLQIAILGIAGVLNGYETIKGSEINVVTIEPEDVILEKINDYNNRREAKDLYDIWVLTKNYRLTEKSWSDLDTFIYSIKPCFNYNDLAQNIYGERPSFKEMVEDIKGVLNDIK